MLKYYGIPDPSNATVSASNDNAKNASKPITLAFSPTKQHFNSLNILAEASRRVGETEAPHHGAYVTLGDTPGSHMVLDPSLEMESFAQSFLNDEDNLNENSGR